MHPAAPRPRLPADPDDLGSNPSAAPPLAPLLRARLSRRALLAAGVATAAAAALPRTAAARPGPSTLGFRSLSARVGASDAVAEGYRARVLARWGDPVLPGAPAWDPARQSPEAQRLQFGQNCDFLAYLPLPGEDPSTAGLLHVNHEYCEPGLMFPGYDKARRSAWHARVEMAAMGASLLEVRRGPGGWSVVRGSPRARRIDAWTPMRLSGPAAGCLALRTSADPAGATVLGTLNNCAGGTTPWGTVLMAEENFNYYFGGGAAEDGPHAGALRRYGIRREARYALAPAEARFDLDAEPNEANRFGWVVEYDPLDPASVPVKRTALGRFKHEGATCVLNGDGRVVVYSGDDERFEYLYRFTTAGRHDPARPWLSRDLLDAGELAVARFDADGVDWLPLAFGQGPLVPANGFGSQADVVVQARRAADLLGATPMDRPEDVAVDPRSGRAYVMLTNNARRAADRVDAANPWAENLDGHVLELRPPSAGHGPDHAAPRFGWEVFLRAGPPGRGGPGPYHPGSEAWLSSPDNALFDAAGRLWVATDQGSGQRRNGIPDGLYACDVEGPGRALVKLLYAAPAGAEVTGPELTPDGRTMFVAVQHPGEGEGASYEQPATRWPDFDPSLPPRASVVAIMREDGGVVGS